MRRLVPLLLLPLALTACGRSTPAPAAANPWPRGRTYLSTAVTDGGTVHPLVSGSRIMVRFRDPGELVFAAGCNEFTARGKVEGDRFTPTGFGATAKGCAPDLLKQDGWLQTFFNGGPTWQVTGDDLVLRSAKTEIRLRDEKALLADRPLVGPRWIIVTRTHAGVSAAVPPGVAYLVFTKTGLVGMSGCSGLATNVQVTGQTIAIEPIHRSAQPCDDETSELDMAIMEALGGTVTYKIKGPQLTLTAANGDSLALTADDALPGATGPLPGLPPNEPGMGMGFTTG